MLRFLVFDLDDTLYPPGTGLFHEVGRRIHTFLQEKLGLSLEEARRLRRLYYEQYGTTLRGLQIHHHIAPDEYLTYVHDVDVAAYLQPNPQMDAVLATLPQEKVIFTNATAEYARRVLKVLGLGRHFARIFDIYALHFHCKPNPEAYHILLAGLPAQGPECLLIEDNLRNLQAGKAAGMRTFLVHSDEANGDGVDFCADILQIAAVVRAAERNEAAPP